MSLFSSANPPNSPAATTMLWPQSVAFLPWIIISNWWSHGFTRRVISRCWRTRTKVRYHRTPTPPSLPHRLVDQTADEERVFLIGEELEFRTGQTEGEPTFVWRDMEGDVDEFFEFVAIGTNVATQALFETCMYRAMYERKYKTTADHLTDADLQEFIYKSVHRTTRPRSTDSSQIPRPPEPKKQKSKQSSPRKKTSEANATASITSKMQSLAVSSEPSSSQTSTAPSENITTSPFDSYPALVDEEAELHLWDGQKEYFVKQSDGRATIVGRPTNSKTNGYEYWIIARSTEGDDGGRVVLWHKVDPDMNQRWSTKVWSLTWNHMNDKGIQTSWCFRFLAQQSYAIFQEQFTRALWETLHQVPWSTSKVGYFPVLRGCH